MTLKAVSLFSGVGGFDLGLERAGIETVLQAEIDPWCNKVLARHWPNTRRVEDVRCVHNSRDRQDGASGVADGHRRSGEDEGPGFAREQFDHGDIDLVYGGFPCQDLSVAGKRAGLGGERSGLWFEFHRVLSELRPRWCLIENVPGLLSSNSGRDFGILLSGLDELGFDVAWGVLDAQHFGVPQRRRRVFIVGGPSRRSVEQVLSLCESCGGNPAESRAPGERVADGITIRTDQAGANGHNLSFGVASTLDGANGQAVLAAAVSASAGHHGHSSPRGDGSDNLVVAATIRGRSSGEGVNMPGRGGEDDQNLIVGTLDSDSGMQHLSTQGAASGFLVPTYWNGADLADTLDVSALVKRQTMPDKGRFAAVLSNGVRRLTPLECERLQGWPDDWTRWAADGSEIPDSHRYRMIGNGVASPVAEWIGHRLAVLS